MTKLKILIISLIFALATATAPSFDSLSNYNAEDQHTLQYLEEEYASDALRKDVGPDHGATVIFLNGYHDGIQIYNNVTHRNECLAFLPDAHDDIVDIYYAIRHATRDTDYIDLILFVLNKTEHIFQRIQDTRDDCKFYKAEVDQVNMQVRHYLHSLGFMKIFNHVRTNKDVIKQKVQTYKADLQNKNWYQAGFDLGDLVNFVILWEYQPPQSMSSVNSILKHDLSNFNLRTN